MEKQLFQYLFLAFFAFLTGYVFLIRASFYDEDGLPRQQNQSMIRVIGENLAGDYAFFRMLERKDAPQDAVRPEKISAFIKDTMHVDGRFRSFASPMKAFAAVPFLHLPYGAFCDTWTAWGLVLFGFALYTLFALKKTLLMMFAFPAALLSFGTGEWGVFIASGVIFALTLTEDYPKAAAFFAGLCVVEPVAFIVLMVVFIARGQKKAAFFAGVFGGTIVALAFSRYGADAFGQTFLSALDVLSGQPCSLASFPSTLICNGASFPVAAFLHVVLAGAIVFYGVKLFQKPCPQAVQDAYACAGLCLISPFFGFGDYGVLYAGVAFLLRDIEARGFLRWEKAFLSLVFFSIFPENFWRQLTGSTLQMWLAAALLMIAVRRSR